MGDADRSPGRGGPSLRLAVVGHPGTTVVAFVGVRTELRFRESTRAENRSIENKEVGNA